MFKQPEKPPQRAGFRKTAIYLLAGLILLASNLISNHVYAAGAKHSAQLDLSHVFPGADRLGPLEGDIPSRAAYKGGDLLGFVFSTQDTVGTIGFSGKPLDIAVGMDLNAVITGAQILSHSEPVLIIGITPQRLDNFVAGFQGIDITNALQSGTKHDSGNTLPDSVAGATVSSAVIADGIIRSARAIARARAIIASDANTVQLKRDVFEQLDWNALLTDGSIIEAKYTQGQIERLFADAGWAITDNADPDGLFISLNLALLSPARIGQNLLGKRTFNRLLRDLPPDTHLFMVTANGRYSIKGTRWVKSGTFERLQLVQGNQTIVLHKDQHHSVGQLPVSGAPEFRETAVFTIPGDHTFDATQPWRLDLMVEREIQSGGTASIFLPITYTIPESYLIRPEKTQASAASDTGIGGTTQLWEKIWNDSRVRIVVLVVLLSILSVVLVFQDLLVRNVRRYHIFRYVFLGFVVVWLGWYAGAQLTVVNVLTFAHALMADFQWTYFLLDPLMFILWGYVALVMLFWGRGVFCGWLCPFGALQELINTTARRFGVMQITLPWGLHERLWPIKYIIFLCLFAVSLSDITLAMRGAEVEPFKTAITLRFVREWPFVSFAVVLLLMNVFIERFYCRYLCALGAALAIPARLRMFEWLKRRHQCGSECDACAQRCTVQAIHPTGQINPNECIYCLECQTIFFDDHLCPPLVAQRKRREKRATLSAGADTTAQPLTSGEPQ